MGAAWGRHVMGELALMAHLCSYSLSSIMQVSFIVSHMMKKANMSAQLKDNMY